MQCYSTPDATIDHIDHVVYMIYDPTSEGSPHMMMIIFLVMYLITLACFQYYRTNSSNLSQCIVYIHDNYLKRICEESKFQGLKYHGGPISKCVCKGESVLKFVSFIMKKDEEIVSDEVNSPKEDVECEECRVKQNVNELLQSQVSLYHPVLVSSSYLCDSIVTSYCPITGKEQW